MTYLDAFLSMFAFLGDTGFWHALIVVLLIAGWVSLAAYTLMYYAFQRWNRFLDWALPISLVVYLLLAVPFVIWLGSLWLP